MFTAPRAAASGASHCCAASAAPSASPISFTSTAVSSGISIARNAGRWRAGGWARQLGELLGLSNLRVAPNPVELPQAQAALREPAQRILFLGRLRQKKGA